MKKTKHYNTFCKNINECFSKIQRQINEAEVYSNIDLDKSKKIKNDLILKCIALNSEINELMGQIIGD